MALLLNTLSAIDLQICRVCREGNFWIPMKQNVSTYTNEIVPEFILCNLVMQNQERGLDSGFREYFKVVLWKFFKVLTKRILHVSIPYLFCLQVLL